MDRGDITLSESDVGLIGGLGFARTGVELLAISCIFEKPLWKMMVLPAIGW